MFSAHSYHKLQSGSSRSINPASTRRARRSTSTASQLSPVQEQAKTKLTMKVKELRGWLSELGDKNQEHYHRFHHLPEALPSTLPFDSSKPIRNETVEKDDLLGIQSKPSTTSTCPSTAIVEENDPLFAGNFSFDDDSSNQDGRRSDLYRRSGEGASKLCGDEGVEAVTSIDHVALLLKQAPMTTQEEDAHSAASRGGTSYDGDNDDDDYRDDADGVAFGNNAPSMHNSPIFRDQILTKETLDAMSRSMDTEKAPKTLGEHLEQLNENHRHKHKHQHEHLEQRKTLVTPTHGHYKGDDKYDSNSNTNTDSLSKDSTKAPSIAPGVLVSKMASIFLNQHAEARDCNHESELESASLPRRRTFDPRDLSFLRSSVCSNPEYLASRQKDLAYSKTPQLPTTAVGKGIRKFNGPRKTLVERRKDQLHEKFGETQSAVFVRKKTWGQKAVHGKYQQTTTVEKVYHERVYK